MDEEGLHAVNRITAAEYQVSKRNYSDAWRSVVSNSSPTSFSGASSFAETQSAVM